MPDIATYTPYKLNACQQVAARALQEFIVSEEHQVFILKGYAGTGKTMLVAALIKYFNIIGIPCTLLASTGRASKVVSAKANTRASTVHRHIYTFESSTTNDELKIKKIVFKLRTNYESPNTIYIIDESSMLSNHASDSVFTNFGTGRLLSDLIQYAGKRKIIFTGDPAQLPPINTVFSPALNARYLNEKFGLKCMEANLTQVMRFKRDTGIYYNAEKLRTEIEQGISHKFMKIKTTGFADLEVAMPDSTMIERYVSLFKKYGPGHVVFIAHTNKLVTELNNRIRPLLYPGRDSPVKGELLLVAQNNYKHDLTNGEHIIISSLSKKLERRAGFLFRDITYRPLGSADGQEFSAKLLENYLYLPKPAFDAQQEYNLYVDLIIRIKKMGIQPTDDIVFAMMLTDPYYNAIKARFGYAVTCHKAQGGEWPSAFIIIENNLWIPDNLAFIRRWAYTAITRATQNILFYNNLCFCKKNIYHDDVENK